MNICTGNNQDQLSLGSLKAENKALQITVAELSNSLSQANSLIESKEDELTALKTRCEKLEQFRKYKRHEFQKWEENWRKLKRLSKEESDLIGIVEELKQECWQAGKQVTSKEEEVMRLTRRLHKLQDGRKNPEKIFPPEDTGRRSAISIFPEEVWEAVFQKLSNSKDIWNCSNSCRLFQTILHEWRTTWLFEQAFSQLFKYLPKRKILECRLVSKGWNRVVENFMEDHPSLRPQQEDNNNINTRILSFVNPMKEKQLSLVNHFEFSGATVENDNVEVKVPKRNPFIGRAVTLNIWMNLSSSGNEDDLNENDNEDGFSNNLWKRIYSFLATYGKHIWYLTVNSSHGNRELGDRDKKKMFRFLTRDLSLLVPNLRRLRIRPSFFEEYAIPDHAGIDIDADNLQYLSKLETIEADHSNVKEDNPVLITLIRGYHAQLKTLHLKVKAWKNISNLGLTWPNLTDLQLDQLATQGDFLSLLQVKLPNIRKLGVRLWGQNETGFDILLDVINKLSLTSPLTTLRLYEGIEPNLFRGVQSTLCMPQTLATLEVEHCGESSFYTFLLRFPLLENLHVFWRKTPTHLWYSWESRGEIELLPESEYYRSEWSTDWLPFLVEEQAYKLEEAEELEVDLNSFMCQGRMYESNIWRVLPRLKLFTFQWDVYTRAGHEQFMEAKHGRSSYQFSQHK